MKYHVKYLVPVEIFIEANSFDECMEQLLVELPSNYSGDGIEIKPVDDKNENTNITITNVSGG